jgi:hypothetical protein
MRILQMSFNPPSLHPRNGAEVRCSQNIAALTALGHEVHLLLCRGPAVALQDIPFAKSVHTADGPLPPNGARERRRALLSNEAALRFYLPKTRGLRNSVEGVVREVRPELIWAEALQSFVCAPDGLAVVYSHYDFHYKCIPLRVGLRKRGIRRLDPIRFARLRRAEQNRCNRADHIVFASASEMEELGRPAQRATYVPVVGTTIARPATFNPSRGRVFVFGDAMATAMRVALVHLRDRLWPLLVKDGQRLDAEWHQVGSPPPGEGSDAWSWLTDRFLCNGFVDDLSAVFRQGDACLVSYPEDTGFRVKLVMAAAHGLVNIGYRQSFHCAPEFTPGVDCLVGDTPEELVDQLRRWAGDVALRRRLGEAARALYESAFTFEAQLPRYERVVRQVRAARKPR